MESGHLDQGCRQEEALIDYLYDECEPAERDRLEAHLATCHRCARELESLRFVRGTLAEWTPPEPPLGFRVVCPTGIPVTCRGGGCLCSRGGAWRLRRSVCSWSGWRDSVGSVRRRAV